MAFHNVCFPIRSIPLPLRVISLKRIPALFYRFILMRCPSAGRLGDIFAETPNYIPRVREPLSVRTIHPQLLPKDLTAGSSSLRRAFYIIPHYLGGFCFAGMSFLAKEVGVDEDKRIGMTRRVGSDNKKKKVPEHTGSFFSQASVKLWVSEWILRTIQELTWPLLLGSILLRGILSGWRAKATNILAKEEACRFAKSFMQINFYAFSSFRSFDGPLLGKIHTFF